MIRTLIVVIMISFAALFPSLGFPESPFTVLSYHDILDEGSKGSADMSISTETLIAHFSWIRAHDFHVISLDDIVAANEGRKALPDHAILLTFDDGYQSVYRRVYPLLKLFNYTAVIAPVGKWMEAAPGDSVLYGEEMVSRDQFLYWSQVKEMVDSGLVEVASHSYDLHQGVMANPQGNVQPAATTRLYDTDKGIYESDDDYSLRLRQDLSQSIQLIERKVGLKPRAIIWPYGSYNQQTIDIARDLGMTITMGLGDGANDADALSAFRRILIGDDAPLSDFIWTIHNPNPMRRIRVVHVDLDYIFDEDPVRQEHNLRLLLNRIEKLDINTVYLQAFADPDGNGSADALYFPNRHLPVRADLFNRVAWQLKTHTGVRVYAWMPVLAFEFGEDHPVSRFYLKTGSSDTESQVTEAYKRLSPFSPSVRKVVGEIYEDLAKHTHFSGLLFHDDAYLTDFEDASPWALEHYRDQWKLLGSIDDIRSSPKLLDKWSQHKIQFLIDWTKDLESRVRKYHPEIKTARNLYASVALNPEAERWFGQSFKGFLDHYDYTAIMAMPYLEGAEDADQWLEMLGTHVAGISGALNKTVFELQSINWKTRMVIGSDTLARQMKLLNRRGAVSFGYYPDDFLQGYPEISKIRPVISLNANPYK